MADPFSTTVAVDASATAADAAVTDASIATADASAAAAADTTVDAVASGATPAEDALASSTGDAAATSADAATSSPSILSTIGSVASGLGTAGGSLGGAAGSLENANAVQLQGQQAALNYNLQASNATFLQTQALNNSNIALANKAYEQQRLESEDTEQIRTTNKEIGTAAVAYGSSGVVSNSGSAQNVKQDIANEGALQVGLNEFESRQKQQEYQDESQNDINQAAQDAKNSAQATQNAATVLTDSNAAANATELKAGLQGISAIPQIVNGVSTIYNAT